MADIEGFFIRLMQRKYHSLMEFLVWGKSVRWTRCGNDGIAPTLGGKVVQQEDAVTGGMVCMCRRT